MKQNLFFIFSTTLLIVHGYSQTYIGAFSKDNKLWGYVDLSGNEIIQPKYTKPTDFSPDEFACVYDPKAKKFKLINSSGTEIPTEHPKFEVIDYFGYKEQGFYDGCIRITVKKKYGVLDTKGRTIHAPEYDKISSFYETIAFGSKGKKWFVLKRDGSKIEISEPMKAIKKYREGLAPFISVDEKYGFVNDRGEIVIAAQFEGAGYFSSGLAWVRNSSGKIGFIDKAGKIVIEYKYDWVKEFDEVGSTIAKIGEQFLLLKKDGTEIKIQGATKMKAFNEGIAEIMVGDKWGFVDSDGKWILEPKYEKLQFFVNGYGRARLNGLWGVVDKTGNFVIEPKYLQIEEFFDGLAAFKEGIKTGWGFVNTKGEIVVQGKYDSVRNFSDKYARVKKGTLWGLIDVEGKEVIEPKYIRLNDFRKVK